MSSNAGDKRGALPVPAWYALVPVEPTPEMVDAAQEAYRPFGDMQLAIQLAIAAAPQPVACEPLIRQMRYALALPCDRWNATQSRIVREAIAAADAWLEGN